MQVLFFKEKDFFFDSGWKCWGVRFRFFGLVKSFLVYSPHYIAVSKTSLLLTFFIFLNIR